MRGSIGEIDADENPLVALQMAADDFQHARPVNFACEGDVEISGQKLKKAGQQFGVIDFAAVGRIAIGAWAGVHADPRAFLVREPRKPQVVQVDEAVQECPRWVDLDGQPSLREVDLNLVRTLFQAAARPPFRVRAASRR